MNPAMNPERWRQIEEVYHAALERPPEGRAAFLEEACAGDESLRREVESLLRYQPRAEQFIETPALQVAAAALAAEAARLGTGQSLGPYRLHSLIGRGGMGEVWRARDTRLDREVAVKVLPAAYSADADRLRRFEQEARAAGQLNHPNIVAIYDFGTHEGAPYLVSELLSGRTLREALAAGTLAPRKALDYARQIAEGLAAAHEKRIVHRDLKPENLFITKDERVKILDFGLAKLTQPGFTQTSSSPAPTWSAASTDPGVILGTVGYMAPEQVRTGKEVDHRADIFAFGAILYEMLAGRRAFHRNSAVETLNAILKEEPAEIGEMNQHVTPAVARVVQRCLEKSPESRFQSASDLAFALDALAVPSGASTPRPTVTGPARRRRLLTALWAATLVALLIAAGAGFLVIRRGQPPPSFHLLTFRRGTITAARFAPDGQTVIYSAAWAGNPVGIASTRPESPESRPFGLPSADVLAVSATGELAIRLRERGTLARVPLSGGAPREVAEDVLQADWSPDGAELAIARRTGGRVRIEYPVGRTLYESPFAIISLRVAPRGDLVAFLEVPALHVRNLTLAVVDRAGRKRDLFTTPGWTTSLVWSAAGDELWLVVKEIGGASTLYAVTPAGARRVVARLDGLMVLYDISRQGRALCSRESRRTEILARPPGATQERDLSWLDGSNVSALSDDGKQLLITEDNEGGGPNRVIYLRPTDGAPAVRLGEGGAFALSLDGKFVLQYFSTTQQLLLLPTGAGEATRVKVEPLVRVTMAQWFPDGRRLLVAGAEQGRHPRCYALDLNSDLTTSAPRPITPEGTALKVCGQSLSPDGKWVVARDSARGYALYPVAGGAVRPLPGLAAGELPIRWSSDGRALFVFSNRGLRAKVYRLDVATQRKELWHELAPSDPAGVLINNFISLTPDGRSYAYTYERILSDLYLIVGWH